VDGLWIGHFALWAGKTRPQDRVVGAFSSAKIALFVLKIHHAMTTKKENPQAYSAAGLWVCFR